MADIEEAKRLFVESGLAFPALPETLASRLKRRSETVFSTRELQTWPYSLHAFVDEIDAAPVADYAVISHSGHGINSYAVQYYLVQGSLRMFLHIGWGGVYMDTEAQRTQVRDCFSLADEIVAATESPERHRIFDWLTIVASDFYGGQWTVSGQAPHRDERFRNPVEVLADVRLWLTGPPT